MASAAVAAKSIRRLMLIEISRRRSPLDRADLFAQLVHVGVSQVLDLGGLIDSGGHANLLRGRIGRCRKSPSARFRCVDDWGC